MKKNEDGRKVELSAHPGNKVLPISDQTTSSLMNYKKESIKGEIKTKALSRMKELFRWAASRNSDKSSKFIKFRNHATLKKLKDEHVGDEDGGYDGGNNGDDDDGGSMESPKISLRWDVESCCTISSALSSVSERSFSGEDDSNMNNIPASSSTFRKGKWITTDSDFVVLELRRD